MESAILLQKGLGPDTSLPEATDLIRKYMWSFGMGRTTKNYPMIENFAAKYRKP